MIFIPKTNQKWINQDIHFGFNIIRLFRLSKPKAN
jgi:hypothetical protein